MLIDYPKDSDQAGYRIILNTICAVIIIVNVGAFEVRQITVEKWAYLSSYGNLNDILFLCTFWCYFGCDYFLGSTEEDHEHYEVTRILMSVLIITGFGKLMSLNRINSNISFILQMILKVAVSIVPFMTLFITLIVAFSLICFTLGLSFESLGDDNPYKGIGKVGYIFYLFRTSTGDFDVDQFKELPSSLQFTLWAFWTMLVLLNTIVFLNLLIAVISDIYNQVMETRTEEIFKRKAELLVEMQTVVGDFRRCDPPHLLITRSSEVERDDNKN